jgi:threonine dehydratase
MPTNSPDIKINAVRELGGTVELIGESFYEAQVQAQARGRRCWDHVHKLIAG